ncbi:MAG TPA: M4 family metallopeptidase [Bacteroidales bacterium]|nr:M4 family metallopeptidase [Bacteroidales bacterium]
MEKRILFFCLVLTTALFVASTPILQQNKSSSEQEFQKVVKRVSENGWVYFKDNFNPDPNKFFSIYMKDFGLSKDDEMRLIKEETDSIFTFYGFHHYYKGILVEGSSMTLQFKNRNAVLAFGTLAKNLNLDIKNTIDADLAFEEAKKNSKAELFAWESPKWESMLKRELKDSSATYHPNSELVITLSAKGEFKLTYKFPVVSVKPKYNSELYYIDANTGKFVKNVQLIYDATSTGKIYYYPDDKQFTTYFVSGFPRGYWRLQDRTRGIITAKLNDLPQNWSYYDYLKDWDNYWDWLSERPAVSALWAVEKSYDYFHTRGRHGTDNNNREMRLTTLYPDFNAGWGTSIYQSWDDIVVGFFNDTSLAALDIVGHEFTHGVTYYSANFEYVADESGALSEAFSDIFGEVIEYYVDGSNDWKMGSDFFTLRSLDNPHESHIRYGYDHGHLPAYYHENNYWYDGQNVGEYTHTNCGVPDKWFHLLVVGDSQLGVSGIGMTSAHPIAYRTLTTYLWNTPNATFNQAREASINAATYYYGECSFQYQQVMNAWAAVGVGNPAPNPCNVPLDAHIVGPGYSSCGNWEYWNTYPSGGSGNYSYEWYFNYSLVSTSSYLSHYFETWEEGPNYIELIVTDGNQTCFDYLEVWVDCYSKGIVEPRFSLLLYPNPASEVTTLEIIENNDSKESLKDKDCLVYLFDKNGRVFYNTKTRNRRIEINVSNLKEGTYTIVAFIGKDKSYVNLTIAH